MKRVDYCRIRTLEQLRVERMRNKVLLAESRHRFCNDVGNIFSADKLLSLLLTGGEKVFCRSRYFREGYRIVMSLFR